MERDCLSRCPRWIGLTAIGCCAVLFAPARATADEPPDLRRELTYIRMDPTGTLLHLAIEEQKAWWNFRKKEKQEKRTWIALESKAFAELAGGISQEMESVHDTRQDLSAASLAAARFTGGGQLPAYRAGFIKLLQMVAHRPEVRQSLKAQVPSVPASDFAQHQYGGLVMPTGELRSPPPSLLTELNGTSGREVFSALRDHWTQCAGDLKAGREPSAQALGAMRQSVDEWHAALLRARALPSPGALDYIDQCSRLVEAIRAPQERAELAAYLKNRGHAFSGGTAGELLQHVLTHRLVPSAGSQGHLALAEVTNEMVNAAKAELTILEARLEVLKAQSPAHNSALRQRLAPEAFGGSQSGGRAGLNSPAFTKGTDREGAAGGDGVFVQP